MGTLLAPFAVAFACGQALRDGRLRAVLYLGACLPEILRQGLLHLGGASPWFCLPLQSPVGVVPWCYGAALLFEPEWRARAFGALLGGSWLHLLVLAGGDPSAGGGIAWAFPLGMGRVGSALYRPEDLGAMTLAAAVVIAVAWVGTRLTRRPLRP